MGPLLLLTHTLLSSYFFPGRVVDAQQSFIIKNVLLSIEPSADVTRGTNVTVRCQAVISSSSGQEALSRNYTLIRNNVHLYTKTSSTSDDFLYQLPDARVSQAGKFRCSVNIEGNRKESEAKTLTVTGLSEPVLHLNKYEVVEGDEVTATCAAPGEQGPLYFSLYKDSEEISRDSSTSPLYENKIPFNKAGTHRIHCTYTVFVEPPGFKSNKSNEVTVSVRELTITPVMVISPKSNIFEGDRVNISCSVANSSHSSEGIKLYLSHGNKLLTSGVNQVNHSIVALAKEPWDLDCRFEMGGVIKVTTETLLVTELFSVPTLTMSPAEVFEKDNITLICKSERYASERLSSGELVYSLYPPRDSPSLSGAGVFSRNALQNDFDYTCMAQAKGIEKHSQTLTVRPKVPVSAPRMSVVGRAVVGRPFTIRCRSDAGSLPINYTLLKDDDPVSTVSINQHNQQLGADFSVSVTKPDDVTKYRCEAKNSNRDPRVSARLNTTVTVPLSNPSLRVRPELPEVSEGNPMLLTCSVEGTPPVTFKLYREGRDLPLESKTVEQLSFHYQLERLSKEHSGKYYCEAINPANKVNSEPIDIEVHLAFWKKALIVGFCLLALLVLVVVCVLYFIFKRGKREAAPELSVKPLSPKSDDSLTVNLTHNTEVYNAATARVGRAVVVSVWSERPPEAATDEVSSVLSSEPDVEYTEVVHPQPVDPARGAADPRDYGSVEYAELNGEQPEINHYSPEVKDYQDLPVPVD
ncbi:platelet endothelial cell adhesion molecule isoform X4 [Channa argus]|uniref:platelet endothelial cell adhesion molecule isoform X4 n=1 Tax=Channa argus TaxID=215402 RepID=UPI003521E8B8